MFLQSFSNLISGCWLDHEGLMGPRMGLRKLTTGACIATPPPPRQVLYITSSVPYCIVRSQTLVDCYLSGAVIAVGLSSASRRTTAHRPELAVVIVRHSHSSLLPAQAHKRHSQFPLFVDCCFWPACPAKDVVLFVTPVRARKHEFAAKKNPRQKLRDAAT